VGRKELSSLKRLKGQTDPGNDPIVTVQTQSAGTVAVSYTVQIAKLRNQK
jgi:hypothetical protein